MKLILFFAIFLSFLAYAHSVTGVAKPPARPSEAKIAWVTYMQSDNDLWPFALENVADMMAAKYSLDVRNFVLWDKPDDDVTYRLELVSGDSIDRGSFTGKADLGSNPKQELIDMASWFLKWAAAKVVIFDMWSHASGIYDPKVKSLNRSPVIRSVIPSAAQLTARKKLQSLAEPKVDVKGNVRLPKKRARSRAKYPAVAVPGLASRWPKKLSQSDGAISRGFGFDDSQDTYLTTDSMQSAFTTINQMVRKQSPKGVEIIVLFDACLMGMIEIDCEFIGRADWIVASPNSVPGEGVPYNAIFNWLGGNVGATAQDISKQVVRLFGDYYKTVASSATDTGVVQNAKRATMSVVNVAKVAALVEKIRSLVTAIDACAATDSSKTVQAVRAARKLVSDDAALRFDFTDFVDLAALLRELSTAFGKLKTVVPVTPPVPPVTPPVVPATPATPPAPVVPPATPPATPSVVTPTVPVVPVTPPVPPVTPPVVPTTPVAPPLVSPAGPVVTPIDVSQNDQPAEESVTIIDEPASGDVIAEDNAPAGEEFVGQEESAAKSKSKTKGKVTSAKKPAKTTSKKPSSSKQTNNSAKQKPAKKDIARQKNYDTQVSAVISAAQGALSLLAGVVVEKTAGVGLAASCGMNVYYPPNAEVDGNYPQCDFSRKTGWATFIKKYK